MFSLSISLSEPLSTSAFVLESLVWSCVYRGAGNKEFAGWVQQIWVLFLPCCLYLLQRRWLTCPESGYERASSRKSCFYHFAKHRYRPPSVTGNRTFIFHLPAFVVALSYMYLVLWMPQQCALWKSVLWWKWETVQWEISVIAVLLLILLSSCLSLSRKCYFSPMLCKLKPGTWKKFETPPNALQNPRNQGMWSYCEFLVWCVMLEEVRRARLRAALFCPGWCPYLHVQALGKNFVVYHLWSVMQLEQTNKYSQHFPVLCFSRQRNVWCPFWQAEGQALV